MHQLFEMYLGIFFRAILKASKGGNVNRSLLPNTTETIDANEDTRNTNSNDKFSLMSDYNICCIIELCIFESLYDSN